MPKMEYVGPGTKREPIQVKPGEVDALAKTGLWKKAPRKKAEEPESKGPEKEKKE